MKNSIHYQLQSLQKQIATSGSNLHWQIGEALNALREEVLAVLPEDEAALLSRLAQPIQIDKKAPYTVLNHQATLLCNQLLSSYAEPEVPPQSKQAGRPATNKVFLVHGHESSSREQVARFLERLHLHPVILHEQPNEGRTIIEKFTDFADVAYAVVLLTADDIGNVKGSSPKELKPRARQNVVFELGYFIGRLGRGKVSALYDPAVEILSDYSGVLYVTLDPHGAWRLQLAKEMKAAGLPIDLNDAL